MYLSNYAVVHIHAKINQYLIINGEGISQLKIMAVVIILIQSMSLDDGLGIMIGGDMNAHIWELDGCENENGRRMKENMNEIGLQILNCVWDGLNEATWYTEEKKFYTGLCVYGWKRPE